MRKKHYKNHVGILISDKTYQKLIRVTDEAEEPISKFVREIIEDRLDKIKEKGELDNGE
jgi:predicted DNA-binding protein